ncbi:hypothetical protein GCM10009647_080280 [Streptomyces sanglieri]
MCRPLSNRGWEPWASAGTERWADRAGAAIGVGDPVVSVETKKEELVGDYENAGREWHPVGQLVQVKTPDSWTGKVLAKQFRTGSTTSQPTPAGSTSAPTTTPPPSRSSRSVAGGTHVVRVVTRTPVDC